MQIYTLARLEKGNQMQDRKDLRRSKIQTENEQLTGLDGVGGGVERVVDGDGPQQEPINSSSSKSEPFAITVPSFFTT